MSHHVSELTKQYGEVQGCLACRKQSTEDELWTKRCTNCGGRLFTTLELSWWVDDYGTRIPEGVIDFSEKEAS